MELRSAGERPRLGIYGGTFAPPHNGHVRAALDFLREARLDSLLVMPAAVPPHKQMDAGDDPALRLEMARAAFEGLDGRISVSDYEIRQGGASYTYRTLTHFADTTEAELVFLCGTDMFCSLPHWRCPEILFEKAVIACVLRESDPAAAASVREMAEKYRTVYNARIMMIPGTPVEISSTEIRRRVRKGESIDGLVPDSVAERIGRYRLYRK